MKKRVEQIKRLNEQVRTQKEQTMRKLHAEEDAGISWGMGDEEDEIRAYQKRLEEEESEDSREAQEAEEDDGSLLDLEKIKARDDLNDKQRQMIAKVEGIRRQLKKLIDKKSKLQSEEELEFDDTKIKAALKGVDKRTTDLKEALEKAEEKLRTSLKNKGPGTKPFEDDDEPVERRKSSDDEEDEFFDRTKTTAFNKSQVVTQSDLIRGDGSVETYETIKTKLEQLTHERLRLTDEMQKKQTTNSNHNNGEEVDELEAFMQQNET